MIVDARRPFRHDGGRGVSLLDFPQLAVILKAPRTEAASAAMPGGA